MGVCRCVCNSLSVAFCRVSAQKHCNFGESREFHISVITVLYSKRFIWNYCNFSWTVSVSTHGFFSSLCTQFRFVLNRCIPVYFFFLVKNEYALAFRVFYVFRNHFTKLISFLSRILCSFSVDVTAVPGHATPCHIHCFIYKRKLSRHSAFIRIFIKGMQYTFKFREKIIPTSVSNTILHFNVLMLNMCDRIYVF